MKIKKGDIVNFNSPIGIKTGEVKEITGNTFLIKANTYPYSNWTIKIDDIIDENKK